MIDLREFRRQHMFHGGRLRRARRLYLWMVYRSIFDGKVNRSKHVKLLWRTLCIFAVRARRAGLYSPKTSVRHIAFSFMSHFYRFDRSRKVFIDGWHRWWEFNISGVWEDRRGDVAWEREYDNRVRRKM